MERRTVFDDIMPYNIDDEHLENPTEDTHIEQDSEERENGPLCSSCGSYVEWEEAEKAQLSLPFEEGSGS